MAWIKISKEIFVDRKGIKRSRISNDKKSFLKRIESTMSSLLGVSI